MVISVEFSAQHFFASQVLLVSVAKESVGVVFLHLEDLFEVEKEDRLRFKVVKIRVEERESAGLNDGWLLPWYAF